MHVDNSDLGKVVDNSDLDTSTRDPNNDQPQYMVCGAATHYMLWSGLLGVCCKLVDPNGCLLGCKPEQNLVR